MINCLHKKWIRYKNKNITISRENNGLVLENNTDIYGFIIVPQFMKLRDKFTRVMFEGEVLYGNSVLFSMFSPKKEILGEASLNSEGLLYNKEEKKCLMAIKILPKTKVVIRELQIEFCSEEDTFFSDQLGNDTLIITPSYPSLENKYLCGFVHSRVMAYKESGLKFDVVCSHAYNECGKYNFEGIDVLRVPFLELRNILRKRKYKQILIHFFDYKYASVLDGCDLKGAKLYLWVHGPETLYWDWPKFTTPYFQKENPIAEIDRQRFISNDELIKRYNNKPEVTWIFVSDWIKKQSENLIGLKFSNFVVIPNIIDEATFEFCSKDPELRKKVYFLRRFDDCNKYAIDVNVRCILELSRRECFSDMEFNIYGTGDRYTTLIEPLRGFSNVHFYPQFLTHDEIAQIHRENGIGLFATRYDAQGVSMCETAMSGLAIVSSKNGAVEEFLPNDIGLLADTEDYTAYADIIEEFYNNPEKFVECGKLCHDKVAEKCSFKQTVQKEIDLFSGNIEAPDSDRKIRQSENIVLSIVIPSYNVAEFLSHGVKTVISHRNADKLEVLIVNDGSKDQTAEIAKKLMDKYNDPDRPVIKLIDKPNGGHGSTINVGLKNAKGKYFRIIDGDDWVDSEQLEQLVDHLESEESDIVVTDYSEDQASANVMIYRKIYEFMVPGVQYKFEDLCYEGYGFGEWGPILATSNFKTQMLKDTGFQLTEKCFYVDMEFNVYSIIRAKTVVYYPLDIYRYFIGRSEQSVSKISFMRNYGQHEKVLLNILRHSEEIARLTPMKREYISKKLVIPMAKAHYIIVGEYIAKRKSFVEFDNHLKAYSEIYTNPEIATLFVRFHRKTGGLFLLFNPLLKKLNGWRKSKKL